MQGFFGWITGSAAWSCQQSLDVASETQYMLPASTESHGIYFQGPMHTAQCDRQTDSWRIHGEIDWKEIEK